MMNKKMNKKGQMQIILFAVLILLVIFLVIQANPFGIFTSIKTLVDYFLIIILWVIIQVGLIYAYIEIGKFVVKFFSLIKTKIINWSMGIKKYIVVHT